MLETVEKFGCTSVADFGAGVSPIPFLLSENGMTVFTVDLSASIVEVKPGSKLSEWGFLDYAMIDNRITSFNESFDKVDFSQPLDTVYSISVIEHVPARIRRCIFAHVGMLFPVEGAFRGNN